MTTSSDQWPVFAVPWGLVVLGWVVVNWQNNVRETRKEIRSKVDLLLKGLEEIEDLAVIHHTSTQDVARCFRIKRLISRLSSDLKLLEGRGLRIVGRPEKVGRLRISITLSNFDSSAYRAVSTSDPLVITIGVAVDDLRMALESAHAKRFGSWFAFW